ncbi:transposable element Tc1 transposase [Trichonephila clavipes]|nr:transposable element Tc1 transposase [Trichonephila clavipes]
MVWAGIMINGRTCLHVVANGTMMGQRYIDEVLLPHVRLFRGAVGDKFVFMDDNATCHRTLAVQDCLDSEGIQCLVWPARSPDLNPIENVWDALGRQVAGRNYPPTNKNTLIRALTEEWDKLPQQLLDNVVQSMVRRVECCIILHGGHIPEKETSRWDPEDELRLDCGVYAFLKNLSIGMFAMSCESNLRLLCEYAGPAEGERSASPGPYARGGYARTGQGEFPC